MRLAELALTARNLPEALLESSESVQDACSESGSLCGAAPPLCACGLGFRRLRDL